MLSTNPPLPGGGLTRSTTSMGVYSNLASHNRQKDDQRRPRTTVLPVVRSGDQFKLLQAIRTGDIERVKEILEDNPNINLRYMDENDHTVLHCCFDIQRKYVNIEILKLLLQRESPLDDYGRTAAPVLHIAAKLGHALCVYLLLKHGADINSQHKGTYRTALHEAVTNGHRHIVELLLYKGADGSLREREGRSAADLCRENVFGRKDYSVIQELATDKRLDVQEIGHQKSTRFPNTSVSARLCEAQTETVPIMVIRQAYESRIADVMMADQDDITSDLYKFRCLRNDIIPQVTIYLPLFEKSCSSRDMVTVRTISRQEIEHSEIEADKENMVVTFEANLPHDETFVSTSRPTVEQWSVGKNNTVLGSVVDEAVRIHIDKLTFSTNTLISLQIIELPEDIDIKEGQILASTPFYKIDVSAKPDLDITIDLPQPGNLGEDGETVILVKVGDHWKVVETNADDKHKTVSFQENIFPIHASVVRTKSGSATETMVTEIKDTFTLVQNVMYSVCFLCHTSRIANSRTFSVVVECCLAKDVDTRRRHLKGQGYQEQNGKEPEFTVNTSSKIGYKLVFYESAITRKNPRIIDLEFHRKRSNMIQFMVELKGKSTQFINGRMFVYLDSNKNGNKFDLSDQPQYLTYFDVNLLLNPTGTILSSVNGTVTHSTKQLNENMNSRSSTKEIGVRPKSRSAKSPRGPNNSSPDKKSQDFQMDAITKLQNSLARAMENVDPVVEEESSPEDSPEETEQQQQQLQQQQPQLQQTQILHANGSDFLDDDMVEMIIDELSDDWYKVIVLMGVNFVHVEDELLQSRNTSLVQRKLFRKWKESNLNREDCGIPLLLGALFKGGCRNIATMVQIQLKQWYEKWKDNGEEFTNWVSNAYQNSDLLVPSDYPKPMTDAYLVLMSDELPPSKALAHELLISDTEANDILQSPAYLLDGIRVMKILTMFRDRTQRSIDALETLIGCLQGMGYVKLKHYTVMCAKAWLKRTATRRDDPFRYQVDQLMNKLD